MSATNRGSMRSKYDSYQTPGRCIDAMFQYINWNKVFVFLEPCKGEGAIYNRVPDTVNKLWTEIREARDYFLFDYTYSNIDLIVTNPPFSLAMEFLNKSLKEAGTVIYLMRINMLGSKQRADFWNDYPPDYLFPITPRPSFTKSGTDATEYAWFCWDRNNIIKRGKWLRVLTS